MELVICHTTADFDTLGAAVGVTVLRPGTRLVLAGGCHPMVQRFLALYRDEYALLERRAVTVTQVRRLTVVDTHRRDRLGPLRDWADQVVAQGGAVVLYDHHPGHGTAGGLAGCDLPVTTVYGDGVGAATTLVAEQLQAAGCGLTPAQATVMALGIHVDTGSLTYETATPRDGAALAWLMAQGAQPLTVGEFVEPELSPVLRQWLERAIAALHRETHHGHRLGWVHLAMEDYQPGLSALADRLLTLGDVESLLLVASHPVGQGQGETPKRWKVTLIGRVRGRGSARGERDGIDFARLFQPWGGGGHPTAAAASGVTPAVEPLLETLLTRLRQQIPPPPTAQDLMSTPVRTIRPQTPIATAQGMLLRYGHSGLLVVDEGGELVGVIARRDIDLALHHGFGHAPVKGYMATVVRTIRPQTSLPTIEALMVAEDIGRLPVLEGGRLVGVVTRTDVLRHRHWAAIAQGDLDSEPDLVLHPAFTAHASPHGSLNSDPPANPPANPPATPALQSLALPPPAQLLGRVQEWLGPRVWTVVQAIAAIAAEQGWHLYLVGGAVRDFFRMEATLAPPMGQPLKDIDLVVDGAEPDGPGGAGAWLAQAVQGQFPEAEVQIYGRFQTAALVWHGGEDTPPLMVDIATARTEFYPYPAANPEVEASSIRQDLYRRDFTINAMAIRLTAPRPGLLLDFFGGRRDLAQGQVRVLHAHSFIEDPTRIYRAVRFAVRLGFTLEPQTVTFIHHAIHSGIYTQIQGKIARLPALQTRLRGELQLILEAPYWPPALRHLEALGALTCLHPDLHLDTPQWRQVQRLSRWLERLPSLRPHLGQLGTLVPWLMRLEGLLAALAPTERERVATHLQLPQESVQRLAGLASVEAAVVPALQPDHPPSTLAATLAPYDLGTLMLMGVRHPRPAGQIIWRYLTHWRSLRSPLTGDDLKALGYAPGPQFRVILTALWQATLDGAVGDRPSALAFLQAHYPAPECKS